ncbi:MAG: hypothetical protein ACJ73J_10600 [Actinomycetes bacterium]
MTVATVHSHTARGQELLELLPELLDAGFVDEPLEPLEPPDPFELPDSFELPEPFALPLSDEPDEPDEPESLLAPSLAPVFAEEDSLLSDDPARLSVR